MGISKVQHYVPQFLLRNFGNGKKDQIWVYDKSSDRAFPTNAKNVASESRFYDFEVEGEQASLEPWLSDLENHAKSVISTILQADSLIALTDGQRHTLASFLAVQLTRTKTFREEWNSLPRILREHLEKSGAQVAPGSQAEQLLRQVTENESKEQTARIILGAPATYSATLLAKDWVLAATTRRHPFVLSDNPLVRQNMNSRSHRGNLGLATEGIEIYFPLSPTRALALWCPTISGLVHRAANSLTRRHGDVPATSAFGPHGLLSLSHALLSGRPAQYSPENVDNFNSLQVAWSERYVFSSIDDFALAKEMLTNNPELRRGPRSKIVG
jgi:hypothetical protein